ncbi:DUF4367 domain-containing protein [Microaceticoccus formicicus]|uniref:DUF4367 domain-containing protein n=1 Tax=Microaceticoccus formicicus TaxID=3118105 RepID=UPI003CD0090D|nr:DUF4367 domain-containing protein [Peptoniphilaceae bacterium AMB_02]
MAISIDELLNRDLQKVYDERLSRLNTIESKIDKGDLDVSRYDELISIINALPETEQIILLAIYGFGFSVQDTVAIYNNDVSEGYVRYLKNFLSTRLKLSGQISDVSLKNVCNLILNNHPYKEENIVIKRSGFKKVLNKAILVILITIASFTLAMVTSADFRELILKWTIKDRVKYSDIAIRTEELPEEHPTDLESISIDYVPNEYEYFDFWENKDEKNYIFKDGDKELNLNISLLDKRKNVDKKDTDTKKVKFGKDDAYLITKSNYRELVYAKGELSVTIKGDLTEDEIFRIGEDLKLTDYRAPEPVPQDLSRFILGYVPERFKFDKVTGDDYSKSHHYLYREEYLTIEFSVPNLLSSVDTEDTDIKRITYGEGDAYYMVKGNEKILVYEKDGVVIKIFGKLTEAEIFKIADNIK